ncbi:TM2 domain-containing protein [Mycoplasmopsis anatis]|uniref:TM2 domain-containing protein n=1 Tax=Mycoplasmopsis anatis 1340 TaxID=1034808 RepID=F9QE50_9BACT|nr:TM2 domain-containing protein [Mycoplasmopsis anatis]AWX70364.1 TM2 domain-containing protein [Mycoplasmopsis anatis]EGS28994.1 hypothetical protein GIG_03392 [Mycoplasmopsis anatis 1340]VEU73986.1 TM2 domain [Mycoplasmopsis anatis]
MIIKKMKQEEINSDIEKYQKLIEKREIVEKEIPEQWLLSNDSDKKYSIHLILSIFGFLFGIDRFYLGKYISGVIKTFLICVCTPLAFFVAFKTNIAELDPVTAYGFIPLIITTGALFWIIDLVIAIVKPRDSKFRGLKHDK